MNTCLFVDGENFLFKVEDCLKEQGVSRKDVDLSRIDISTLIKSTLPKYKVTKKFCYSARLKMFENTREKSIELIKRQRVLKTNLEKQGFEFVLAGNVRPFEFIVGGKKKLMFKEKGVDVRIAVDLVSFSCDKKIDTAMLCSSDSDLQPAVYEARRRGVKVVYLGFENAPNKGLTYTTDKTVLFRNHEILQVIPKKKTS